MLAERGYAGLSTNRVAATAGVSVGSLYRYFGDKGDLVRELRVRSTQDILGDLTAAMSSAVGLATRDAIRQVLATLVAALRRHRGLTSALVNVLPEVEQQLAQFTRLFLAVHAPHLEAAEADARIYLALGVTLSTCLRIALDPPQGIAEERLLDPTADLLHTGLVLP